jgi:hypothetical protein
MATIDAEATRLATILQNDLDALAHSRPISACALAAPRRRSGLASAVATHLFPDNITEPLHALIQYEKAIIQLRAAFLAQEYAENERVTKENRANTWSGRIEAQGPWDETNYAGAKTAFEHALELRGNSPGAEITLQSTSSSSTTHV